MTMFDPKIFSAGQTYFGWVTVRAIHVLKMHDTLYQFKLIELSTVNHETDIILLSDLLVLRGTVHKMEQPAR